MTDYIDWMQNEIVLWIKNEPGFFYMLRESLRRDEDELEEILLEAVKESRIGEWFIEKMVHEIAHTRDYYNEIQQELEEDIFGYGDDEEEDEEEEEEEEE